MKKKWTRRKFLETGLISSVVMSGGVATGVTRPTTTPKETPSALGLERRQRELLRAAMDEIIPAGDGMPAASAVGGLEYLDRLARKAPETRKELGNSLAALEEISRKQLKNDFLSLSRAERVEVLTQLEKQAPSALFVKLRDYVYEAYYTQPKVWKLIGYEFYPTDQHGPHMKPFDEAVLVEVRKKPKFYREVS
jgi:hypothetical protein